MMARARVRKSTVQSKMNARMMKMNAELVEENSPTFLKEPSLNALT